MISFPCHNYSFVIQQTLASQSQLLIKVQASSVPLVHSHAWSSTSISVSMSKMGWRSLNLILKYALLVLQDIELPWPAPAARAQIVRQSHLLLPSHLRPSSSKVTASIEEYVSRDIFSLDLSWKHHIASTSGRCSLGMPCIAVCVLNETCEISWNSRANVKSDCALKRNVAAASSPVSEPDSLEISPVTFTPFDGTESPGRGLSTRILSEGRTDGRLISDFKGGRLGGGALSV